jgi:hypothetical protein
MATTAPPAGAAAVRVTVARTGRWPWADVGFTLRAESAATVGAGAGVGVGAGAGLGDGVGVGVGVGDGEGVGDVGVDELLSLPQLATMPSETTSRATKSTLRARTPDSITIS